MFASVNIYPAVANIQSMVINSIVMSKNFIKEVKPKKSRQLVINTVDFKHQDLEDFVNISEDIERNHRERQSQRSISKARPNTLTATMTREETFESATIDDDQFLNAMEHETTYDTERDHSVLITSIENLMKYFDEDVTVKDEYFVKSAHDKKFTKGKVATAVASLRNKCGLALTPPNKRKSQEAEIRTNIEALKKMYETSTETENSPSPKAIKSKSHKSAGKTKVRQMASLFNSKINALIKNSSSAAKTTGPVAVSTLKPKSPKVRTKFPNYVTKLPSPKPSPFFKRKHQPKAPSISSLTKSPVTKCKQLQPPSTTCLVAEKAFSQLSVKDKALLYNKFIADMSRQNPKFSKHAVVLESNMEKEVKRGEVIFEKQCSVKYLRDRWEAKSTPAKPMSKTLQRFNSSSSKICLDLTPKSKEYEDILQSDISSSRLDNDFNDVLHVSTLTVVLKPSPNSKKIVVKNKNQRKQRDVIIIEPSHKRTQSMIRSSFCVEPLAPPKKIRRTLHERLAPGKFFQNQHLEKLFYHWLKEKNGIAFDITPVNNRSDLIEIIAKNTSDSALPPEEAEEILEAAIREFESDEQKQLAATAKKDSAMVLIKNTAEKAKSLENSVIEVELPLEVDIGNEQSREVKTEDSDLGLATLAKTTSGGSHAELKSHEIINLPVKLPRKKKLRRPLLRDPNSILSTDSDSDSKKKNITLQNSSTFPKSRKCSNYVKNLFFKTLNNSGPSERSGLTNNEINIFELDRTLLKQVNSPSKIKTAYTLTAISSPSPRSESDFYDSDLSKASIKNISRSWPSLVEIGLDSDTNLSREKSLTIEFSDLAKNENHQEHQTFLIHNCEDPDFETSSNWVKSVKEAKNPRNFSTPNKNNLLEQVFTAQSVVDQCLIISPISSDINSGSTINDPEDVNKISSCPSEHSSLLSHGSLNNNFNYSLSLTKQENSSQYWITSGHFSAAITIYHCETERLMLLSNIYVQKTLETKQLNFGIDDEKFYLNNTPNDILKKLPRENNCSQYWFSTGNVVIPFSGEKITTNKIQSFFKYIRELAGENVCLRFGIDSYEFSHYYQHSENSSSPIGGNIFTQAISPLKTSDLDQSDVDSEENEQSDDLINLQQAFLKNQPLSLEQIFDNFNHINYCKSPTLEMKFTINEILKILQHQQSKLKILEERLLNCSNTSATQNSIYMYESSDYMRKLRSIITTIESIGRANAFNVCTLEQLQNFMFLLSRYADFCLANCTNHIEKILDVVTSQSLM